MLAILSTHPIQYQVPLWKALAKDGAVPFEVWYLSDHGSRPSYDSQFGKTFAWDIDLLSGYPHRFVRVKSKDEVSKFAKLRLAESLREPFRRSSVSALWVQGWHVAAYWQAVWQAHRAGVPVWLRGESNDLTNSLWWKARVKRAALTAFFKRVENFLYIGEANRRLYRDYGVAPQRLHPAPYCVDNERFIAEAERLRARRQQIREQLRIPSDAFCVLFAAKFIEKKRPRDVIAAARRLQGGARPVHLLFVGSGELGAQLRESCAVTYDAEATQNMAADLAPEGRPSASFAGFLNQGEIAEAYAAADCLVLPSDERETWGLVVNEAMASGLPCVVSDACGCGEDLVEPLRAKLRFPLGDTAALADAIRSLMVNPMPAALLRERVSKFEPGVTIETVKKLSSQMHAPAGR